MPMLRGSSRSSQRRGRGMCTSGSTGLRAEDGRASASSRERRDGAGPVGTVVVVVAPAVGVTGAADLRPGCAERERHAPGPSQASGDVADGTRAAADGPGAPGCLLRRTLRPRTVSDGIESPSAAGSGSTRPGAWAGRLDGGERSLRVARRGRAGENRWKRTAER